MTQPDEGLIHAWLDHELPPDEAARVEQLVAHDAEWAAAAAEARGLIAASARILSSLDDVPANVIPTARPMPRRLPWWTRAAAAVLVVAGGSVLVLQRSTPPSVPAPRAADATVAPSAQRAVDAEARKPAVTPTPIVPSTTVRPKRANTAPADRAVAADARRADAPSAGAAPAGAALAGAPPASVTTNAAASAAAEKLVPVPAPQASVPITAPVREATQMLRTAGAAPVPRDPENRAAKATADAHILGGVAAAASPVLPVCFMVRDAVTPRGDSVARRQVRQAGDTVFLASTHAEPAAVAWILRGTGPRPGVRYTGPAPSGAIAIIATPMSCPKP
jgi:hypothetical protein